MCCSSLISQSKLQFYSNAEIIEAQHSTLSCIRCGSQGFNFIQWRFLCTSYLQSGHAPDHAVSSYLLLFFCSQNLHLWNGIMLTSKQVSFPPNCLPECISAVFHHLKHVRHAWRKSFPYQFWHGYQPWSPRWAKGHFQWPSEGKRH